MFSKPRYRVEYRAFDRNFNLVAEGDAVVRIVKTRFVGTVKMHEPSQAVLTADTHFRKSINGYAGSQARVLTVSPA